jgi:hypothetical protein
MMSMALRSADGGAGLRDAESMTGYGCGEVTVIFWVQAAGSISVAISFWQSRQKAARLPISASRDLILAAM